MSGTERNRENVRDSKFAYTEEEVGQLLQLLIFFFGDLKVFVCMHTRKICLKGRNMRGNFKS